MAVTLMNYRMISSTAPTTTPRTQPQHCHGSPIASRMEMATTMEASQTGANPHPGALRAIQIWMGTVQLHQASLNWMRELHFWATTTHSVGSRLNRPTQTNAKHLGTPRVPATAENRSDLASHTTSQALARLVMTFSPICFSF